MWVRERASSSYLSYILINLELLVSMLQFSGLEMVKVAAAPSRYQLVLLLYQNQFVKKA